MSPMEAVLAWCREEQVSMRRQLEMMESGKMRVGESDGRQMVDTTAASIATLKDKIADLDALLAEYGEKRRA